MITLLKQEYELFLLQIIFHNTNIWICLNFEMYIRLQFGHVSQLLITVQPTSFWKGDGHLSGRDAWEMFFDGTLYIKIITDLSLYIAYLFEFKLYLLQMLLKSHR